MPLSKTKVEEKLDAWAKLQKKISKAETERNEELDPFIQEHNAKTAPVIEKHSAKISPLREKSFALQQEIESLLKANVDEAGNPKPVVVKGKLAMAEVSKSEGARVISAQKFFDAVQTKNEQFWNCVNVVIKHAEKLVGKAKIDEISEKKTTYQMSISLKK